MGGLTCMYKWIYKICWIFQATPKYQIVPHWPQISQDFAASHHLNHNGMRGLQQWFTKWPTVAVMVVYQWPTVAVAAVYQMAYNRVHCQSRFPMFIMAQRHYVGTSATCYQCGDNCTKVKTFVMSAWYHWWHAGPYFGPYLICGFARRWRTLLFVSTHENFNRKKFPSWWKIQPVACTRLYLQLVVDEVTQSPHPGYALWGVQLFV